MNERRGTCPDDALPDPQQGDVDVNQIEYMMSLTPRERLEHHGRWLAFVRCLKEASGRHYGSVPADPQEPG